MPDNTIEWGQGAVNNTNDWGKAKANATNNFGAVYDDSPSLDTNITGSTGAVLSITYSASAFCEDASDPTPTVSNNVGAGTFSSTTGLVFVSTTTGQVDLSASTSGATYLITYTDTNSATATFSLTVNALDDASFAYSQSSYAPTDADPTPTVTLAGGTFSAGTGLVFVDSGSNTGSSTGEIDLSASTVASYTITYTTAGTCPNTSTQTVEIASALAQISNVYSMEFDGSSASINVGQSLNIYSSQSRTISCWFNINSFATTPAGDGSNLLGYGTSGSLQAFSLAVTKYVNNPNHRLYLHVWNNTYDISGTTQILENNWYLATVTYDGSTLKLYLNGNLEGSSSTSSLNTTTSDFIIGQGIYGTWNTLNGKIDEVAIFNVELTAQEVLDIYNATETGKTADLNDLTTPPIKWYRMGD